jgi:hypothetical protein
MDVGRPRRKIANPTKTDGPDSGEYSRNQLAVRNLQYRCNAHCRTAIARPALGNFKHEAVAVDTAFSTLYLTEDESDGRRLCSQRGAAIFGGGKGLGITYEISGSFRRFVNLSPEPRDSLY